MKHESEEGHANQQRIPVKLYRTPDRLMVAAPMPGLQPADITIEVTAAGRLILHGELREGHAESTFEVQATDIREGHPPLRPRDPAESHERWQESSTVLLDEWDAGGYHRELDLPAAVDGELGTATYGNGVLVVALPVAERTRSARFTLEPAGPGRGQRVGSAGHPVQPLSTDEHRAAMEARQTKN